MKNCFRLFAAFSISLLLVGQVQSQEQPTPEERAYEFRHGLFETFSWKLGQLYGAQAKDDAVAFKKHAKDLAYLSGMLEEGFQLENSLPEGTRAKAEIWENYEDFQQKAKNLGTAAAALTEDGAMESFNIRDFGSKTCGSCHRDFRVKESKES
jgi:cytochrome c556